VTVYERYGKRIFDILFATAVILAGAPLMCAAAIAIRLDDGGPALFRQERMARAGRRFTIYKFRSMPVATPNIPSSEATRLRLTRVGGLIRRTNIDELPQLLNVLSGDMSVIGPRPCLPTQEVLVRLRREREVDLLRPGLTGLAQVNAFDGMTEVEKVAWEARYAERITFIGDIVILLRTVGYLFRRPPVY
jgi:lipopolysaccharide/colanic/teichoic acid biosynthesis glycosyltransferase